MVQFIAQEFRDMLGALEDQTGCHVSFDYFDTGLGFTFVDPHDETGDLDIYVSVRWYEIDKLSINECATFLAGKFLSMKS